MALPRKIRDKIIVLILPINPPDQDETGAAGSNNGKKSFRGRICNSIHPILWTCRQLRYEYGQLYCTQPAPSTWPQEMPLIT